MAERIVCTWCLQEGHRASRCPKRDHYPFRVWPDGTVQDAEGPAHVHMSDDYVTLFAPDEESALEKAKEFGHA